MVWGCHFVQAHCGLSAPLVKDWCEADAWSRARASVRVRSAHHCEIRLHDELDIALLCTDRYVALRTRARLVQA